MDGCQGQYVSRVGVSCVVPACVSVPQGDKGEAGPEGAQGERGHLGPKGKEGPVGPPGLVGVRVGIQIPS